MSLPIFCLCVQTLWAQTSDFMDTLHRLIDRIKLIDQMFVFTYTFHFHLTNKIHLEKYGYKLSSFHLLRH